MEQKELEMVMGCADGKIILLDPECYENKDSKVSYFNMQEKVKCTKKKKVDIVRWYEDNPSAPQRENTNKFLVVFEDGVIYTFYKGNDDTMD